MAKLVIGTNKTVAVPAIVKIVTLTPKYSLLSRVKDDNNTDIGCVIGYHIDANNQKYAVVALNAQYRGSGALSTSSSSSGLPAYTNLTGYAAKETATYNCDTITTAGYAGSAITGSRANSFYIDGVQYFGQVPTVMEMLEVVKFMTQINANDPTASSYSSKTIKIGNQYTTSTFRTGSNIWYIDNYGYTYNGNATSSYNYVPVLEIPINE